MSRYYIHLLAIALVASLSISSTAQESLISDDDISRVIKLRSSDAPVAPSPTSEVKQTSRMDRVAKRTMQLPNPSDIQFDEIDGSTPPIPTDLTTNLPAQRAITTPSKSMNNGPTVDQQLNSQEFRQSNMNSVPPFQQQAQGTYQQQGANNFQQQGQTGYSQQNVKQNRTPAVVSTMAPQIATKILSPRYVNINEQATLTIQVQNVSRQPASMVKLIATLPSHVKFASARPQPSDSEGQQFEFTINQLGPRQVQEVQLTVVPNQKVSMEIGTRVIVSEKQNVMVGVRQPDLQITISGPEQAHTGQWIEHLVTIENRGDGFAENIQLSRKLPKQLTIAKGQQNHSVRSLAPGQKSQFKARTFCEKAGKFDLGFELASRNAKDKNASRALQVFRPELQVTATGPNMNFINRDGIYTIQIENPGHVDVTDVQVDFKIPRGFEVTTISRQAKVDPKDGTLAWRFKTISAKSQEAIQLKAVNKVAGLQVCKLQVRSNETKDEQIQLTTEVATRADVSINISNEGGPVEVGGKTELVVNVANQGSSVASGVEVEIELAASLMPVTRESYYVDEMKNSIRFDATDIKPGESREFRFGAVGVNHGEHVVRSVVMTSDSKRRLIAEDSVYVFEVDRAKVSESLEPSIRR